jgi:hypothetical protein
MKGSESSEGLQGPGFKGNTGERKRKCGKSCIHALTFWCVLFLANNEANTKNIPSYCGYKLPCRKKRECFSIFHTGWAKLIIHFKPELLHSIE